MKKLMIMAAMSAGMLGMGDVQQAEAGGRNSFGISIGSSPYGNSFGLTVGRGISNRGYGYGPGLYRGSGYRGLGYGAYGGGGLYRRPVRNVYVVPGYGGGHYRGGYSGYRGGRSCGY